MIMIMINSHRPMYLQYLWCNAKVEQESFFRTDDVLLFRITACRPKRYITVLSDEPYIYR